MGAAAKDDDSDGAPAAKRRRCFESSILGRGARGLAARLVAVQGELHKVRLQMAALRAEEALLAEEEAQLMDRLAEADAAKKRAAVAALDWGAAHAWEAAMVQTLKKVFGHRTFRPLQREALNAVLSGRDVFAVMPTGSGKSLCYQLPASMWTGTSSAVASRGMTLVISPLLSLMHDQVRSMKACGIEALMLNSDTDVESRRSTMAALPAGKAILVYTTPEFLVRSKQLLARLQQAYKSDLFRLIAIDEAHCCSQWGHEFRPDYLKLKILRENFPTVPILALTATATEAVQRDVEMQLGIPGCLLLRGHYNRPNLFYSVALKPEKKEDELAWLAQFCLQRNKGKTGLIYCLSCRDVDYLVAGLVKLGVGAVAYHSQRTQPEREAAYSSWVTGKKQVVVATIAFGMGIDKQDVRFVVHHSMPKSVENYYQESGRAGRDGKPADCVLLLRPADVQRLTSLAAENPNRERNVGLVYEMLLCADPPGQAACRRKPLAKYFGDVWRARDCRDACDCCCKGARGGPGRDCSALAQALLRLMADAVDNGVSGGTRLTMLKAVEVARSDASTATRLRNGNAPEQVCKAASPRDMERVLARLLALGYLVEEFFFTAFGANGYLRISQAGLDAARAGPRHLQMHLRDIHPADQLRLPGRAK